MTRLTQQKVGGDGQENAVPPEGWVALPGTKIVRETNHRKYNTRDQIDERLETEQVHQLGPISHQVTNKFNRIII